MNLELGDTFVITRINIPPKYYRSKTRALTPGKIVIVVDIHSEMHVTLKEIDSRYRFIVDPRQDGGWFRLYTKKIASIKTKEHQRLARLLFS